MSTVENATLTDCYYEKKDWRLCKSEVSDSRRSHCILFALDTNPHAKAELKMEAFRQCWKRQGNDERTDSKKA